MTRRELVVGTVAGLGGFACRTRVRRAAPDAGEDFLPSVAVSLRALAKRRLSTLGGLNRLVGVSVARDGDVWLLGHRETTWPEFQLDDLAIALRSAFKVNELYQEPIGCTIDPQEGAEDPWVMQRAKTFGIEPSAMAARHVFLDYEMKKASLGLIVLKPGMPTLMNTVDRVSDCASKAAPPKGTVHTAHRFWFCPKVADSPRFVRDGEAIWIEKPVGAQVLTEEEFLDSKAHRVGSKPAEGSAVRFANAMTKLLESGELARYTELRSDFRLIEAAKLVKIIGAEPSVLRYYLENHVVRKERVPAYVGGLWREESTEFTCANTVEETPTPGGTNYQSRADIRQRTQKVVGGVEARVPIEAKDLKEDRGLLSETMRRVRAARPSADAAVWPV